MKRFLQAESDEKSVIKANSSADLLSISGAVSMFFKNELYNFVHVKTSFVYSNLDLQGI